MKGCKWGQTEPEHGENWAMAGPLESAVSSAGLVGVPVGSGRLRTELHSGVDTVIGDEIPGRSQEAEAPIYFAPSC